MAMKGLYAGSFDPLTNGHLSVIRQGLFLCEKLVIAIGIHPGKKPLFSFEERAGLITDSLEKTEAKNVKVIAFNGLVVEAAKAEGASVLIRGLRNATDFDYEMQMAGMNGELASEIKTVFLPAEPGQQHITGTLVRQIAAMKGDISSFVPEPVAKALQQKF